MCRLHNPCGKRIAYYFYVFLKIQYNVLHCHILKIWLASSLNFRYSCIFLFSETGISPLLFVDLKTNGWKRNEISRSDICFQFCKIRPHVINASTDFCCFVTESMNDNYNWPQKDSVKHNYWTCHHPMALGEDRAIAWRMIDGHNWQLGARHSIMLEPPQEAGNRTNSRFEMHSTLSFKDLSGRLTRTLSALRNWAIPRQRLKAKPGGGGPSGLHWGEQSSSDHADLDREMLTSQDRKPRRRDACSMIISVEPRK